MEALRSYSDQAGKFPVKSRQGIVYIFIPIHAVPIPNQQAATICDDWKSVYATLASKVYLLKQHILDNECSQELKEAFQKYSIDHELIPPAEHYANALEIAIISFPSSAQLILTMPRLSGIP